MTIRRLALAGALAVGLGIGAADVADAGHKPSHYPPGNPDPGPPDGRDPGPPGGRDPGPPDGKGGPKDRSASVGAAASSESPDDRRGWSFPVAGGAIAVAVSSAAVGIGAIAKARGASKAVRVLRGVGAGRT